MSAKEEVRAIRASATAENQAEKIWEAIELLATKVDSAPGDAAKGLNDVIDRMSRR